MRESNRLVGIIKFALRCVFPGHWFAVIDGGKHICWLDDGPTRAEVEHVLLDIGCATLVNERPGGRRLELVGAQGGRHLF
jgi:hypothetical protein